jgi:phosphate transport system permease protein
VRDGTNQLLVFLNNSSSAAVAERPDLLASAALPANTVSTTWLGGGQSLLASSERGLISQWLLVHNDAADESDGNAMQLREIRRFQAPAFAPAGRSPLVASDANSRTFLRLLPDGELSINNATSQRQLIAENINATNVRVASFVADGGALLAEHAGGWSLWPLDISHAEVSFSSLLEPVWYEGYSGPDYVWQSSSAGESFEPKLSLVPLTFGTLKAAFYAMLIAAPLAICGAIYTGYFMAPGMRRRIKPLVELMEALPTVVLGFLAGLWLAPYVESNLFGIFSLLVLIPFAVLLASFAWSQMPPLIRLQMPPGFEAALLLPVIVVAVLLCLTAGPFFEGLFFNGDMKLWLSDELGIGYDQRNAMVVGFAMGFAVIPTMFSIAEDAVFTVPKHLSDGSLALGANAWQSLFHVVLPTASPGIFSAVMIGLGRAVGETMIVLMATGNTPIMDVNIFEGMRTLAANMAVEVPESEVGSSHYRVLFLSALLLFAFTFVLNTAAEIVRQSLRQKYSSL